MRRLFTAAITSCLLLVPMTAHADWVFEGSAGSGWQVKPSIDLGRQPTNIMLAGGYGLDEWIRLELGVVGNLGDIEGGKFDVDVRPMLVLDPPLIPIYGRAIVAGTNLLEDPTFAAGLAVGLGGSIAGFGLFAEVGMVPRLGGDEPIWILEGRGGVYFIFD